MVCGDPNEADTYFGGFDKSQVSPISCPDNLAFDSKGNLWVSTDGNALDSNDGLFAVVLDGPRRGETRQFLTVPAGGETCGPIVSLIPDGKVKGLFGLAEKKAALDAVVAARAAKAAAAV